MASRAVVLSSREVIAMRTGTVVGRRFRGIGNRKPLHCCDYTFGLVVCIVDSGTEKSRFLVNRTMCPSPFEGRKVID